MDVNGALKKNAAHQVFHVYGIFTTGNKVFSDQMISKGPTETATTINSMPKINLNKVLITKNPPKDKRASSHLLPC